MKHVKLFEQFINEKKEVYTVYVEDDRKPGGTDKEIKKDYNLTVANRTKDGFDLIGAKKDIEDFVEDYSIIGDIELYEGQVYEAMAPNMPVMVKAEGGKQRWNDGASQSSMLSTVRKLVTPEGKKALAGAYMDDADLVNNKTSKTIVTIKIGMTPLHIAKAVDAWAEKHAAM